MTTVLRAPHPNELRPAPKRITAIRARIADLNATIDDEELAIENSQREIDECTDEIEELEAELKTLEADREVTLDAFGAIYPGPGEYGERLLDEATRPPAVIPYGAPLAAGVQP